MVFNEKLKTSDGTQVLLFPLPYMNISQDEGGSYSHAGTLCIDFLGWNSSGRVYNQNYYAPCDLVCVYKSTTAYYNIWDSIEPVLCADGVKRNICIMNIHGDYLFNVGDVVLQGEVMGKTGAYGQATGDHCHLNVANGHYVGQEIVSGNWQLKNSIHIYDACFINDTVIVDGKNHPWKLYDGPIPIQTIKTKFPWVLYARKLRKKRILQ